MTERRIESDLGILRVPFSEQTESPDEWVYSTRARIECDECGEWIYVRRHINRELFAFPPECQVCGAKSPKEARENG